VDKRFGEGPWKLKIHAAAERLEKAIRGEDAAVPLLLEEFASRLGPQVQAIVEGLRQTTPVAPQPDTNAKFDAETASAAVKQLKTLLEASDADAEEAFSKMQDVVAGQVEETRLSALAAAISKFDFGEALSKLDEIAREYHLNGGQAKR